MCTNTKCMVLQVRSQDFPHCGLLASLFAHVLIALLSPAVNSVAWAPYEFDTLTLACGSSDGDISILTCTGKPGTMPLPLFSFFFFSHQHVSVLLLSIISRGTVELKHNQAGTPNGGHGRVLGTGGCCRPSRGGELGGPCLFTPRLHFVFAPCSARRLLPLIFARRPILLPTCGLSAEVATTKSRSGLPRAAAGKRSRLCPDTLVRHHKQGGSKNFHHHAQLLSTLVFLSGTTDWVRDVAWAPSLGLTHSIIASCGQV